MNGLGRTKITIGTGLLALAAIAAALALTAVLADSASAQQPAICEQYPQLPQCDEQGGGGGGDVGGEFGSDPDPSGQSQGSAGDETIGSVPGVFPGSGGPTAGAGGGTGGELPFTGYPLTPLLLILLILLLAGLLIRAYLAARERWLLRDQPAPPATAV